MDFSDYMDGFRRQALFFTIAFLASNALYAALYFFGLRVDPLVLDLNHMLMISGFWIPFIVFGPFWYIWIDSLD